MITHIVAYTKNHVIGRDNVMPWHLPSDLAHFKRTTLGKPIIMGRKTFESIGRPLPGRENIVITRDQNYVVDGVTIWHDLSTLHPYVDSEEEVFLIGGGELFAQTLPLVRRIYVTEIDATLEGDVYYPEIPSTFQITSETHYDAVEGNDYSFVIRQYDRSL
ncbi:MULTISPECIES: dihydrofolate reductase [unclassified Exiguobacterium]|uniref:dihydrofolate reductase n=1 Tax=unclassified Exiguobacterium TaxID=2644629 RepID=UPI0025C591A8|nr:MULTISPECIES: dihydrofolate reductase [unclassified Exiguobacterium]